jgi:hypothetical protein
MRKAFLILLCVVIVIGIGISFFLWPVSVSKLDVQKLLTIADNGRPLREALERFKRDQGNYPAKATNLFHSYLQLAPIPTPFDWGGWDYLQDSTNSYYLFYKINWDDHLAYEHLVHGTDRWYYSASGTQIDLTHKLRQR